MPWAAPNHHACGHPPTVGRCPICAENSKRLYDTKRPSANARGYTSKWQQESKEYLKTHPYCWHCGETATLVDHVVPHKGDMKLFWDRKNWQPSCASHHSGLKQSIEKKEAQRGRV